MPYIIKKIKILSSKQSINEPNSLILYQSASPIGEMPLDLQSR